MVLFLRVDEGSSDFYIDRNEFFFCSGSNLPFSLLSFDFCLNASSFILLKERQTPLSNSESVNVTKNKNVIGSLGRMDFNHKIFQRNIKKLPIDPLFSKWLTVVNHSLILNLEEL